MNKMIKSLSLATVVVLWAISATATTVAQFGGTYANWPAAWTALTSLNDPTGDATPSSLDFYSGTGATAYYAQDGSYLYFRMRINDSGAIAAGTLSDSYFLFIDRQNWSSGGTADGFPDFAFAWDAKSNDNTRHGLEMSRLLTGTGSSLWSDIRMTDVDGLSGQKGTQDFGGIGGTERTGDGYIQTTDNAPGGGAFIDIAVSLNYLANYSTTGLNPTQSWKLALGSVQNATDHSAINGDVGGGSNPNQPVITGWTEAVTLVPEPSVSLVLIFGLLSGGGILKRRMR